VIIYRVWKPSAAVPWESSGVNSADLQQESSDLVRRANKTVDVARSRDPLPGLREVVAGLSNDQAHAHFRRVFILLVLPPEGSQIELISARASSCASLYQKVLRSLELPPCLEPVPPHTRRFSDRSHFRRVRPVVYTLRDTTINLNTEIKALTRHDRPALLLRTSGLERSIAIGCPLSVRSRNYLKNCPR